MRGKVACLLAFAVSMAFIEAAVVVYLREIIGEGPVFPMKEIPANLLLVEVGREAATIVMLVSVAILSVRGGLRRMGAFLLTFSFWDIFYYLWLAATIGWPAGIGDWDVLFLIPMPWVGPVWSVLLLCAGMIVFSFLYIRSPEEARFSPGPWGWASGIGGAVVIVANYILEWRKIGYGAGVPTTFSVLPFFLGLALLFASGYITFRNAIARRL
ncbi:MAG TPA: hypothetical protein VJ386_08600 [Candidatus Deferrimicrobiaceae bacterium]|jgi:hypothetical protein|nr:hypothetical protein [Candidatus Deferrimicrobiaceae bacterium]